MKRTKHTQIKLYILSVSPYVCSSVCPSVTLVTSTWTVQDIDISFTSYDSMRFNVFGVQFCNPDFSDLLRTGTFKKCYRKWSPWMTLNSVMAVISRLFLHVSVDLGPVTWKLLN